MLLRAVFPGGATITVIIVTRCVMVAHPVLVGPDKLTRTSDKVNVAGLVLAGSADFKNDLNSSDLFDPRL